MPLALLRGCRRGGQACSLGGRGVDGVPSLERAPGWSLRLERGSEPATLPGRCAASLPAVERGTGGGAALGRGVLSSDTPPSAPAPPPSPGERARRGSEPGASARDGAEGVLGGEGDGGPRGGRLGVDGCASPPEEAATVCAVISNRLWLWLSHAQRDDSRISWEKCASRPGGVCSRE